MRSFSKQISAVIMVMALLGCTGILREDGTQVFKRTPLVVFAAGSLIIPFQQLETAFESENPDIDIQAEYHGSIQVIRHASDLHEQIDIVATADASLLPLLMYQILEPETGLPYASWHIEFASNQLAIAYRPDSLYSDQISADNWYSILNHPEVRVGIPDPRFDAAGYRTLMTFALARAYYHDKHIFTDMFAGDFSFPFGIFEEDLLTIITVPKIVETTPDSNIRIRGGSIALLALLESGDLDYAFEYESVIQQHGLEFVNLPDELNLGSAEHADYYSQVQVILDFQRFAAVEPVFTGERIAYGITIPSNALHPNEAERFIAYLLGQEGRGIMELNSHPLSTPPLCDNSPSIPSSLQGFCFLPGPQ